MLKLKPKEIYDLLIKEERLLGAKAEIVFKLKGVETKVTSRNSVGDMMQDWMQKWLTRKGIFFQPISDTQEFPDFLVNPDDLPNGQLDIKVFDFKKGPGFDVANFDKYRIATKVKPFILDSDYIIVAYSMVDSEIKIEQIWLKKVWEIVGPSGLHPIKLQVKHGVIYNIRPITWYSSRSQFKSFSSKEEFIDAFYKTIHISRGKTEADAWKESVSRNI